MQRCVTAGVRHVRLVEKSGGAPPCDVLVEAGGTIKPARLCVSTGALARPRIGTSGKCSTHMYDIVVTVEVSHSEMSRLKLVA